MGGAVANAEPLPDAVRRWRSRLRFRAIGGATLALVVAPLEGLQTVACWLAIVFTVEFGGALLIDHAARRGAGKRVRNAVGGACNALVFLSYALVSVLAGLAARSGAAAGLSLGCEIAGMSLVSLVVATAGHRGMFFAGLTPVAIVLGLGFPFAALWGGSGTLAAGGLFFTGAGSVLICVATWHWLGKILQRETAARAQAEASTQAKSRFVATISHELRTPISAIQAGARAIGDAHPQADLIVEASRMMKSLLDDLLDQSKLEAGRLNIAHADFELRRALASAMRFWREEARRKTVRLIFRGARSLPVLVSGDEVRLRQILNNLLSNACKFSAGGVVTVLASHDGATLQIVVQDTGIGMSEDQMSRLFQPFSQADDSVARTYGGTGLGLAISRDLALAMGGDLQVTSALSEGTAFTLTTPLPRAALRTEVSGASDAQPLELSGLRVLVADDHEVNRRVMTLVLGQLGVDPTLVEDGAAALEVLGTQTFDVVMLDVHMPGLNGYETARRLRMGAGPNKAVPIIAVTGALTEEDQARRSQAGMDFVVAKPLEPARLIAVIGEALKATNPDQAAGADRRAAG